MEQIRAVLPAELAPAFAKIQTYWEAYQIAATEEARQIHGPGYKDSVALILQQRADVLDALRNSKETPLEGTAADVKAADDALNEVYARVKALTASKSDAAELMVQIRTTQLAWLKYRKAFEAANHTGTQKAWAASTVTKNRTGILTNLEKLIQLPRPSEPTQEPVPPVEPVIVKPTDPASPLVKVLDEGEKVNAVKVDYVEVKPLRLSKDAVEHIVKFETGGRSYYEKMYQRPQWPGYASGVTIGFGYDVGYNTKEQIQADWAGVLGPKEITALLRVQGVTGSSAKYLAAEIKDEVFISWETAKLVFEKSTLPHWSRMAADAYVLGRGELPPDCNGALVGNAFNRGTQVSPEGKRRELYLIREAIRLRNWSAIPELFRAQRKYWPDTSGPNGLQTRRSEEAALWEKGVKAMKDGVFPPVAYDQDDIANGKERTYYRTEVVGPRHPIWKTGEIHPAVVARKNWVLGIGREGEQRDTIRAGTLYAASAAAHAAEVRGFHFYVTSGNRWGVSTSPNHGQNEDLGDSIDFVVKTKPGGVGSSLEGAEGKKHTYDILACAAVAAAKDFVKPGVGVGWGRSNGAGHHIEVDDSQRTTPDAGDVWPYSDSGDSSFLSFERDYANGNIFKKPEYLIYEGYFEGKLKPPVDPAAPQTPVDPAAPQTPDPAPPESND